MKKCPTCDKTYEDSMRFCQADGTTLVDDASAFDPYATIVGVPKVSEQTVGSIPIDPPDVILDIPEADPLKTMYASKDEMSAALGNEPEIVEIPPIEETPEPEPPSFNAPDVPAPTFGSSSPPPSPFSSGNDPMPAPPVFDEPPRSRPFDEAETMIQPGIGVSDPFASPSTAATEWAPPPAPEPSWQNQPVGQTTPFQPPMANLTGENKTLAIVSLVLGILGLTICCGTILPSIAAIITGFMARNQAKQNPSQYGGEGLALAGLITGALGLVGSVIFLIVYFVLGLASLGIPQ